MPFGPTNEPPFYTFIVKKLEYDWDALCVTQVENQKSLATTHWKSKTQRRS